MSRTTGRCSRRGSPRRGAGAAATLATAWLLVAPVALAQEDAEAPPDYAASGVYAVVQGAYLLPRDAEGEIEAAFKTAADVDPSMGLAARLGYRAHPRLATELLFEWIDEWDFQVGGVDTGVLDGWTATVNAKLFLLTGRIQPHLLAGMGFTRIQSRDPLGVTESEKTRFAGRVGLGTDIWITESWAVNLAGAYTMPSGALDEFDYVSLLFGIQHRF